MSQVLSHQMNLLLLEELAGDPDLKISLPDIDSASGPQELD